MAARSIIPLREGCGRTSVMNRRDGREAIFEDAPDWEIFMATLAETCRKTGWQVHAWCLMPNLFHLMVETPQPNSAVGMRWLLST